MQRCCSTQHCNWWDFEHIESLDDETANVFDPMFQRLSCRIQSNGRVFLLRRKTISGLCRTVCEHHSNGWLNSRCLYLFWICAHWKCRTICCHETDFVFNRKNIILHSNSTFRKIRLGKSSSWWKKLKNSTELTFEFVVVASNERRLVISIRIQTAGASDKHCKSCTLHPLPYQLPCYTAFRNISRQNFLSLMDW